MHGDAAQATKATQVTENALGATAKSNEHKQMEKIKYEVEKNLVQMARMSRQNEELLKIFLCKEEMEREAERLKELGIIKASPWMARELPVQSRTSQAHIAQQDPAIIECKLPSVIPLIFYTLISPLPSLETPFYTPENENSDSDCVITGYTPPKKRNVVVKTEPSDSVSQLAKGTENLLL